MEQPLAEHLDLLARHVRALEIEVQEYRQRDQKLVGVLIEALGNLRAEAARSSSCKAHYLSKQADALRPIAMMLGARIEDVI